MLSRRLLRTMLRGFRHSAVCFCKMFCHSFSEGFFNDSRSDTKFLNSRFHASSVSFDVV